MCFVQVEMLTLESWPASSISNYVLPTIVSNPLLLHLDSVFFGFSLRAVEMCYRHCCMTVVFRPRGPSILAINEVFPACKRFLQSSLRALHKSINNRCTWYCTLTWGQEKKNKRKEWYWQEDNTRIWIKHAHLSPCRVHSGGKGKGSNSGLGPGRGRRSPEKLI